MGALGCRSSRSCMGALGCRSSRSWLRSRGRSRGRSWLRSGSRSRGGSWWSGGRCGATGQGNSGKQGGEQDGDFHMISTRRRWRSGFSPRQQPNPHCEPNAQPLAAGIEGLTLKFPSKLDDNPKKKKPPSYEKNYFAVSRIVAKKQQARCQAFSTRKLAAFLKRCWLPLPVGATSPPAATRPTALAPVHWRGALARH